MKALIVDDNDAIRQMYQSFLENMGFTTDEAENGSGGFSKIQDTDYDVIVSDMDMPVVNGMEFYQLVSSYRPHLLDRIVFSTGNSFNGDYKNFFGQIACPVLYKPFPLAELENTIISINNNRFNGEGKEVGLNNFMPIYA